MKLPKFFNYGGVKETVTDGGFEYTVLPPALTQRDLSSWKNAVKACADDLSRKSLLYDIYTEQLDIDGHLSGLLRKRTSALLGAELVYVRNGKEDEAVTDWMQKASFQAFIKAVQESVYFGHTLIWFGKQKQGEFTFKVIDRKHVNGDGKFIMKNQNDNRGLPYGNALQIKEAIEVCDPYDFGLMKTAIYYSIIKRNLIGDWANYSEEAGRNFRTVKYKGKDVESRNALLNALKMSGSGGVVSVPEGMDVDIQNMSSSSQNQLFENFMDYLNKEQSKLILGQTMTTDDGSSRAQAGVHEGQQDLILHADRVRLLNFLNYDFYDYLPKWGIAPGGEFQYRAEDDIDKMLERDLKLSQLGYVFTQEYLEKRYGVNQNQ